MENASEDPNAPGALMLPPGEIERWVRDFHDERARSGGWPTIYVRKRDASNIALLLADEEETVSGFDAVGLGAAPRGHQHFAAPAPAEIPTRRRQGREEGGHGPRRARLPGHRLRDHVRARAPAARRHVLAARALLQLQGRRRVAVAVAGRVQRVDRRRGRHFWEAALRARLHDGAAGHSHFVEEAIVARDWLE